MSAPRRNRWGGERDGRGRDDDRDASFRTHFGSYLLFGVFFFVLNLITDAGNWWFYWPMFGWGIAVVAHAFATYGADAPARVVGLLREWLGRMVPLHRPPRVPSYAPPPPGASQTDPTEHVMAAPSDVARIIREGEAKVDAMRREARRIPKVDVRAQALEVCAAADRILAVLTEKPADESLARDFLNRYLTPAEAIVSGYARLANRGVATAAPTLARVERDDLPLLDQKFNELYDRLHRGELIDLEVAREMLQLDFATAGSGDRRTPETPAEE